MLPIRKRNRLFVLLSLVMALVLITDLRISHVSATEYAPSQSKPEPSRETEIVSDLSPEEMAREILVLQQQLGGSIVPTNDAPVQTFDAPKEQGRWQQLNSPVGNALITDQPPRMRPAQRPTHLDIPRTQIRKIEVLRETAFNLDRMAHELEQLDLYQQADSIRETATHLRENAREIKHRAEAPRTEHSNMFEPPSAD